MKREKLLTVVFIASTIGFFACQKDKSTVPSGPSTLGVKIQALNKSYSLPVNSGLKSAAVAASSITWDTAQMVVSSVKFSAELKGKVSHRDSIQISYKWTGPQVTDLLDTTISFGNFILQPGFYDEVEIAVLGLKTDAKGSPVFYLHGTYTKNETTTIPVIVKVSEDVAFKTEKDSVAITNSDQIGVTSYIQLFLDKLMMNVQPSFMDNAKLTNGVIVISATSNRDLYWIILQNLFKNHQCHFWHGWYKEGEHHH